MKSFLAILLMLLAAVASEPPTSKNYLTYSHWPAKSAKQTAYPKTKTLMVQIRSDHPVPLVFKGRPGSSHHSHGHYVQLPLATSHAHSHIGLQRRPRPIKYTAPIYLKTSPMKQLLRQPIKIKLPNTKLHTKPIAANYEKPYIYEKPISMSYLDLENELPTTTKANFISEHFAPIHTVPAPNLALHDNLIHHDEAHHVPAPKPQTYHQSSSSVYKATTSNNNYHTNHIDNQYQVLEEITNDATFVDPISDSQKLFAPDPDPSLPTSKIRPASEPYNQPSNGKPLPSDIVQSNNLLPVQPLIQIVGAQHAKLTASDIYPLAVTAVQQQQQQQQLQPFVSEHLTAIQAAPIPNYNPTYLVTQSNNLYSQHKQQLFQPYVSNHVPNLGDAGYVNADLTQEVANDGQILQAAKHPKHKPEYSHELLPQFAALIAAPALEAEHAAAAAAQVAPFSLPNVASAEPQGGFVISNYYNNGAQDNSQLLQAYAEEEAHRNHQYQAEQVALELQAQQQQQQHNLKQVHEAALSQHQLQSHNFVHDQSPKHLDSAAAAFEEHQRLVQQHLGNNTPLRIFVPDDDEARVQKRSGKDPKKTNA